MIARYNSLSLRYGVPGLVLQTAGAFGPALARSETVSLAIVLLALLAQLVGTVLLLVGLGYYAKAKGRSPVWAALGLLSIIGVIFLGLLRDRSQE